jgi:hypothetical protein
MLTAHVFRSIFGWMMGFVAMTWVWAVGIIMAWPWEKNIAWEPDFRLVATCKDNEACSVPYGQIAAARAAGVFSALHPPEPFGEVQESDAWLKWRMDSGKPWHIEVSRASWDFETTVRYRLEGETPVLIEIKRYDVKVLLYAMPLALLMVGGMFLRSLRGG